VSLRSQLNVPALVEILRSGAVARVGVSPVYTALERTSQALHLARIALASSPAGDPMVNVFDDAPLPVLVASSPTTSYRVTKTILGPLLDTSNRTSGTCSWTPWLRSSRSRARPSRRESTRTATPTRCATGCAAWSVRPAAPCTIPDRQRNYSSPWWRCARCPGRWLHPRHQAKALCPVMSRPTRSVWISAVPS
jgi:hypothetical protein